MKGPSHRALAERADRAVALAQNRAAADPQRPRYHVLPPAHWNNDPNGPLFFRGRYHLFYQHNPFAASWGNMSWGHAVSRDLAHWEHWPIALVPTLRSCDKDGIFSGCCVIHRGVPHILYTGVSPEVQCLATSRDGMKTWKKHPANPLIQSRPPGLELEGFRDPYVWREGRSWYMALGSGFKDRGGAVLLHRSSDLVRWNYLHPLCVGDREESGPMWECPNFFPLGDRHLLCVSPYGPVLYWLGQYKNHRFSPRTPPLRLDLGDVFYAPNSLGDDQGRRLLWGWVREARPQRACDRAGWSGCLTLPRVLSLEEDGSLRIEPAPELQALRRRHWNFTGEEVGDTAQWLRRVKGDCLEILAEFAPGGAPVVGFKVRRAPGGAQETEVICDRRRQRLEVVREKSTTARGAVATTVGGPLPLGRGESLCLRLFLDRSVLEVYARGQVLTTRIYPSRKDALGLDLFARGGKAQLRSLEIWEMNSIWE